MKVFNINPAIYSTNFKGKNNQHKTNPQKKVQQIIMFLSLPMMAAA